MLFLDYKKRIIAIIFLTSSLFLHFGLLVPNVSANAFNEGLSEAKKAAENGGLSTVSINDAISEGIKFFLGFVAIIAVAAIIYGGFLYITDAGSEKRAETGKKVIIYAIIGLIVIGAAALVTNVVISTFK